VWQPQRAQQFLSNAVAGDNDANQDLVDEACQTTRPVIDAPASRLCPRSSTGGWLQTVHRTCARNPFRLWPSLRAERTREWMHWRPRCKP
jgi:hypothetical protein